jgi:hypothetical protein
MLEGPRLHITAFPTLMVWPLDESQGSSPLQGHGSWLMCEVALTMLLLCKKTPSCIVKTQCFLLCVENLGFWGIAIPKEPSFSVGFWGLPWCCERVGDDGESDEFEHVEGHVNLSDGDERPCISAGSSKISHPASPFGTHLTWMASGDCERCLLKCGMWSQVWSSYFYFAFRKSCGSEVASHSFSNLNNIRIRARNLHKPFSKLVVLLAFYLCLLNLTSSCGGANDKVLEKWNRFIGDSFISTNTECEAIWNWISKQCLSNIGLKL